MKLAKISPCGILRRDPAARAGVHRKTKMYIAASKQLWITPSSSTRPEPTGRGARRVTKGCAPCVRAHLILIMPRCSLRGDGSRQPQRDTGRGGGLRRARRAVAQQHAERLLHSSEHVRPLACVRADVSAAAALWYIGAQTEDQVRARLSDGRRLLLHHCWAGGGVGQSERAGHGGGRRGE